MELREEIEFWLSFKVFITNRVPPGFAKPLIYSKHNPIPTYLVGMFFYRK